MYILRAVRARYQFCVQLLSMLAFMNEHRAERVVIGVYIISLSLALPYNVLEMICVIATPFMHEISSSG
jgi:hypothetical protein